MNMFRNCISKHFALTALSAFSAALLWTFFAILITYPSSLFSFSLEGTNTMAIAYVMESSGSKIFIPLLLLVDYIILSFFIRDRMFLEVVKTKISTSVILLVVFAYFLAIGFLPYYNEALAMEYVMHLFLFSIGCIVVIRLIPYVKKKRFASVSIITK